MFDNKVEDSSSTKKSNSKVKQIVKIALIVFLVIIVISVIIAFSSSVKQEPIPEAGKIDTTLDNQEKKHYDFLDNENLTFKFTEKEFIEKFAKTINRNVKDFSISRRNDGYISYSYTNSLAEIILIGINSSKQNNKVTDIEFEYSSLVQYRDDESLAAMGNVVMDDINCIISEIDKEKFNSNGYSEEEKALLKDNLNKLEDCIKKEDGLYVTGNHGGQGQVSTLKIKYSVIQ